MGSEAFILIGINSWKKTKNSIGTATMKARLKRNFSLLIYSRSYVVSSKSRYISEEESQLRLDTKFSVCA